MKILASYSIKGGVGKTASAVNLAYLAAEQGYRTLLWDLDPQGASSYYFRIKPKVKIGSKKLISGDYSLDDFIKGTDFENLDLLPADFSYRNLDLDLEANKKPTQRLQKLLKPLNEQYDIVFLDCPPNISLLSEAVFQASEILISPIIPTTLSLRTLEQLQQFIKKNPLKNLQLLAFFSMVDKRKALHKEIIESFASKEFMLNTSIPNASEVERMGIERQPLAAYANKSRVAMAYQLLWQEIVETMGY